MQQSLLIKIIPFTAPPGNKSFAFYTQKQDSYYPILKNDFEDLLDDKMD